MPGVALQHVHRQSELGEACEPGIAKPLGVAQLHGMSFGEGHLDQIAEGAQRPDVGGGRAGLVAAAVAGPLYEQEKPASVRVLGSHPVLLFNNDFGDLLVAEDSLRCDVDLAPRVSEPRQRVS